MTNVTIDITLTLQGPLITQSGATGRWGLDAVVARTADGRPCVPFSVVKGKLRDAWRDFESVGALQPCERDQWLGSTATATGSVLRPNRGRLRFSDFTAEAGWKEPDADTRHRIRIDARRGSVERGMLLAIESPFAAGERVDFLGTVSFIADSDAEAAAITRWVDRGLHWMTSLGAERTIGFGRLLDVRTQVRHAPAPGPASTALQSAFLGLVIRPSAPFCLTRRPVSRNLFESDDVIPGAAVRGALASMLSEQAGTKQGIVDATAAGDYPTLRRDFHLLRVTHAFPAAAPASKRPVQPPLSLVEVEGRVLDVALCREPVLINNQAPAFAVDWKESGDVVALCGLVVPDTEMRVRTAIDPGRRRSEESQLFALNMVRPQYVRSAPNPVAEDVLAAEPPHETGPIEWCGGIDFSRVPQADRAAVVAELQSLLAGGLTHLGKTKAHAAVELHTTPLPPWYPSSSAPLNSDGRNAWVITLQTPALVADPSRLNETSGASELSAAYSSALQGISQGVLHLSHYFTTEELAGGNYLQKRFMKGDYVPYLLTSARSVFVLVAAPGVTDGKAAATIQGWLDHGLPLPSWAKERYSRGGKSGDDWDNCPYIPENGYGEVSVNMALPGVVLQSSEEA